MDLRDLTAHEFVVACRTLVTELECHVEITKAEVTEDRELRLYIRGDFDSQETLYAIIYSTCQEKKIPIDVEQVEFIETT